MQEHNTEREITGRYRRKTQQKMRIEHIITTQTQDRRNKQSVFSPFFALRDTKRYTDREIHTKEEKTSQRERKWVNWSFYGVG